jgi:hypothetical protein
MAHGLGDEDMKKEHFDSPQGLADKLDKLAEWIKNSKHFIVFTGTWHSARLLFVRDGFSH